QGPVAGEDRLRGDLGVDRLGTEGEGVDVAQDLRNRLGGDEAQLAALGREPGDDPGEILRLVDVTEVAAGVHRMLALGPQATAMAELDLLKLPGFLQHVRIEVTE